jgi:hypothetical protein
VTALRLLLAALAAGAAFPGAWAVAAPRLFFADFPGAGRHWTSELPAYSEHLVTDVGAFYLAFALMFAWAVVRPARALVLPLCCAFALFSAVHLAWHATHLDPFGTFDAISQAAALGLTLIAALATALLARRSPLRA